MDRTRRLLLPAGLMACLVVLLMPLPTAAMDLLLSGNIALAVVILLTAIHVKTPLEFGVFPTLLLATTLSRLVLNIASTRLILKNAPLLGDDAAGGVIHSFGKFVGGNQIEIGLIIFLILVVVQFVVITKGATRISEVAARFALDGMPGRQSAIDADVQAGNIDSATASAKRSELLAEADFYSAMDGAGKFVRGDAIAGLVITAINLVGGLYLGMVNGGMSLGEAASIYTRLTIGDGLVSQLPSLLIALAAGVLVTRGTRKTDLPSDFVAQLLGNSRALFIAGAFLLLLTASGLPIMPMILLGSGTLLIAIGTSKREREKEQALEDEKQASVPTAQKRVEDFLSVDPLEVAIGLGLLPLADPSRGGDLMQRIAALRNLIASEIGIVLPKVRVRDDATLGEQEYEIRLFGDVVARRELRTEKLLAVDDGRTTGSIAGETVLDTITGRAATWIDVDRREQALIYGYTTRTPTTAMTDHLEEVARSYADELLSRDATKHLLDELRKESPAMVDELVPSVMKVAEIQKALQGLLRESLPIRQLGVILEGLSDAAQQTEDPDVQIEFVRSRLARTLCAGLRDANRVLHAVTLDQDVIADIDQVNIGHGNIGSNGKPSEITCDAIRRAVKKLTSLGHPPVILVAPPLRRRVKHVADLDGLSVHVLSTSEITSDTQTQFHAIASYSRSPTQANHAA